MQTLTDNDESELLELVRKQGDSDALQALIGKHQGIVADVMRKYVQRAQITGTLLDDLLADIPLVVFDAAKRYDPEVKKTKFSTWLWDASRFYTFNFLRKEGRNWQTKSPESEDILLSESADDEVEEERELHGEQMQFILKELESCPDERIKQLFRLRYLNASGVKMTFADLAKRLDLSCQGACFLHDKFIQSCKKKLKQEKNS